MKRKMSKEIINNIIDMCVTERCGGIIYEPKRPKSLK